jgi:hypothetical protein
MSETMTNVDPFDVPAGEEAAENPEEFEPGPAADPEEPETLDDEATPLEPGEANVVDVIEQQQPAGEDDDGY